MLLSGRVRTNAEETVIREVVEAVFKRSIDPTTLFNGGLVDIPFTNLPGFDSIVWTPTFLRLLSLAYRSLVFKEPVLLVGETG